MGNSDSKLVFKQGIFKLSEPDSISADDQYWRGVSPPKPSYFHSVLTVDSSGNSPSLLKMFSASFPLLTFDEREIAPSPTSRPSSEPSQRALSPYDTTDHSRTLKSLRRSMLSIASGCLRASYHFSTRQIIWKYGKVNSSGRRGRGGQRGRWRNQKCFLMNHRRRRNRKCKTK